MTKLAPQNQDLSKLREETRLEELRSFVVICSGVLSMPLFMVFWVADCLYVPQLKWEFLILRSAILPVCVLTNFLMRRVRNLSEAQWVAIVYVAANSLTITTLVHLSEGIASPYYAGLNLVTSAIITFLPWTRRFLILNFFVIYAPYYLLTVLEQPDLPALKGLALNSFFITGTIIITLVVRFFTERLRRKELATLLELQTEIKNRGNIIAEKTKEALRLTNLSKQFSPQVVQAIQENRISIEQGVRRSRICVIFIDIVNSTDRVIRIDQDDVKKVIARFMEDTMKVLLKYDITIDKFLGDGVLAFCNDPIKYDDYIERVVNAALEIRERIRAHRDYYVEHWHDELQIRTGIADGYANVGFYGNDIFLKTYTAIGRVMNLACRLCAEAEPEQIIICPTVKKVLSERNYRFEFLGERRLKGFESDITRIYSVVSGRSRAELSTGDIPVCPEGHGILHLATNSAGIYVFTCRTCHYQEGSDVIEEQKAVA